MKTTDLFRFNRSSERINESLEKTFGTKINFQEFDTAKLEDARNKLRTQIHTVRSESGFNETLENPTLSKAQFMHDAIVAELAEREEYIVDTTTDENYESMWADEGMAEAAPVNFDKVLDAIAALYGDDIWDNDAMQDLANDLEQAGPTDQELDFIIAKGKLPKRLRNTQFSAGDNVRFGEGMAEGREFGSYYDEKVAQQVFEQDPDITSEDEVLNRAYAIVKADQGNKFARYKFNYDEDFPSDIVSNYFHLKNQGVTKGTEEAVTMERDRDPEDWDEGNTEPANNFAVSINGKQWKVFKGRGRNADDMAERNHFQQLKDWAAKKSEATGKKWTVSITGAPATESIEEKAPPTAKGERMVKHVKKGYADDGKLTDKEKGIAYATAWKQHNKEKNEDMNTSEAYINNAKDAIDILADIRQQSKLASRGEADPVRPNQLINDLWDVMQWIEANMEESIETESSDFVKGVKRLIKGKKNPSDVRDAHLAKATFGSESDKDKEEKRYDKIQKLISKESTQGEDMARLQEGEIQQASAIVTAKTMVDRVGRWIEELSGMENDTLLQLGDSIRDEMGQEQAKAFIEAVAPAIQQALETLKGTRDTLSTGVRSLASGEQPTDMLGAEPDAMGGDEMAAEPDTMNMGDEMGGEDEFAAAEPAAGGLGDAGREQRESIDRSNSLLRALAG